MQVGLGLAAPTSVSAQPPKQQRLPEGRLDKARAYLDLAREDLAAGRLQSAESFLRLAAAMEPASLAIKAMLNQVVSQRATQR